MPVHLCSSHCTFPFKANLKLMSFLPRDRKKNLFRIWSVAGPDLKCSDSLSEMRPRLKSHVDRAYHHRAMTYWAQADGGWFSLTRINNVSWFLSRGFERPVSTGASVLPPKGLKVSFWHDERHHLIANEILFLVWNEEAWSEKSDLLALCSIAYLKKAAVCTNAWCLIVR